VSQHKDDKLRRNEPIGEQDQAFGVRDRIHNQWEVLDFERRFAEGLEQSVRYALIVFGVTNTAAVLVLARSEIFHETSAPAAWSVRVVTALYTMLAVKILGDALRALRPQHSSSEIAAIVTRVRQHDGFQARASVGVLPVGMNPPTEEEYHAGWQVLTPEELSWQLSVALLALGALTQKKHTALRRLYAGLTLSVLVTALLVATLLVVSAL
jgi:hypothetical protein